MKSARADRKRGGSLTKGAKQLNRKWKVSNKRLSWKKCTEGQWCRRQSAKVWKKWSEKGMDENSYHQLWRWIIQLWQKQKESSEFIFDCGVHGRVSGEPTEDGRHRSHRHDCQVPSVSGKQRSRNGAVEGWRGVQDGEGGPFILAK